MAHAAGCHARVSTDRSGKPLAGPGPSGLNPAQFHGAYGLPATGPAGQTIAIVDAYDSTTIESDLGVYSSTFGLPACTTQNGCFSKVNQSGAAGPYPAANAGWALEIALDVETAHAICQNCKILLVEATSNSLVNLAAAENTAATLGATVISNSFGGAEYTGETSDTAYNHPGIPITVSAGDTGFGAEYPASSPYVVAVGGTTLTVGPSNTYGGETVWSGSGSGCSAYTSAQAWQTADAHWSETGCGTKRGVADVAADADPGTGASVYDTTKYQGQSGWLTVGGTSLAAPLIAGVYGLAGGGSGSYPAALPYAHQSDLPAALHDVTSGSNGTCGTSTMCKGAAGYDGPTGVGTPNGLAAFGGPATVDGTPPQTTIDSGPSGPTNDPTPTFAFHSSEAGSSFECSLGSGSPSFGPCSGPGATHTPAALGDGSYTFAVRATDPSSNTDTTPATRAFSVDTATPVIGLAAPANGSHTSDATPALSGTAGIAARGLLHRHRQGLQRHRHLRDARPDPQRNAQRLHRRLLSGRNGALPGHLHGAGLAARLGREQRIQRRQHVHHRRPAADRHAGPHLAGRLGGADRVRPRSASATAPPTRAPVCRAWSCGRGRRAAPTRRLPRTALRAPRAPSPTARQPATAPMTSTPAPGTTRTTTRRLPLRPIRRRNSTRPLRIRRSTRGPPAQARTAGRPSPSTRASRARASAARSAPAPPSSAPARAPAPATPLGRHSPTAPTPSRFRQSISSGTRIRPPRRAPSPSGRRRRRPSCAATRRRGS